MKLSLTVLAIALATMAGDVVAQKPNLNGALPTPANRIVGVWKVDVAIGPCALPNPVAFFSAYNTFHAGGTISDFNWISPTLRSPGHGIWKHMGSGQYQTRFQFFRYDNPPPATASGIQDIRVQVTLDAGGEGYTGVINGQQQNLDGSPAGPPLCGQAVGTRMGF